MAITVKQHTIPKLILKNWYNIKYNRYYILDTRTNKVYKKLSLKSFGYINNYYELLEGNKVLSDTANLLEHGLGVFETHEGKLLKKIKNNIILDNNDKILISACVISQILRTPIGMDIISEALSSISNFKSEELNNICKLIAVPFHNYDLPAINIYAALMSELLKNDIYILTISPLINLDNTSFLLGLNLPVIGDTDLISKSKTYYFPISPANCIIISNKECSNHQYMYTTSKEDIDFINSLTLLKNNEVLGLSISILNRDIGK